MNGSGGVVFETGECLLGHDAPTRPLYEFQDAFGTYSIVQCAECGFSFLTPRPTADSISVYYEAVHYTPFLSSGQSATLFSVIYSTVRTFSVRWKRKKIESAGCSGRILDVGCGTGEFLNEMATHGWEVRGVEPSPDASRHAIETYGLTIKNGLITEGTMAEFKGMFDVITAWHVLEHVHDLKDTFRWIVSALKPDGLLVVAVPNMNSYDAKAYGPSWIAWDPPRHLWHFTPSTLKKFLEQLGLVIEKEHQVPLDAIFNTVMSEAQIARKRGRWFWPLGFIRAVVRMSASFWSGMKGQGSSMMYYVRKR